METLTKANDKALPYKGLDESQIEEQKALGNVNIVTEKAGKSYFEIITDNLFTFFNLVWLILTIVLVSIGSYANLTFLLIIVPNLLIAIIQEIKAKKTVEKLSVTTEPKALVIRCGKLTEIDTAELVIGDIMKIETGKQVMSDSVVLSGVAEANESMLTGESDAIKKSEGDTVLAGSFLVSGSIYVRVIRVGKNNYVHKIESAAKGFKAPASHLFRDLTHLIKYIGFLLIPMAAAMFISNYFAYKDADITTVIKKTCGSVIGMIPAGIYLLVTLTLTLSVISLSKKRTLVQDMYSIEMLASADIICLDKTGTITDGSMCVTAVESLNGTTEKAIARIMALVEGSEESINNTSRALIDRFGSEEGKVIEKIPFSSKRKYSAVNLEGVGFYAVGAPHFVPCPISDELDKRIEAHAKNGERVVLLVRIDNRDEPGEAVALIAISDRIRPGAAETIAKFQDQGVSVKIISGDHAATVSTLAGRVGVAGYDKYLSCESVSDEELAEAAEEYSVFGRVTPEQKVLLIRTLKKNGHVVAMTGDGVNDTLALKESNCAIAMADGSEVARKISQIVLLDSDFGALPDVVREGRRCINNVRQSSSLYLMKTIFTLLLSIYAMFTVSGYPFEPKQFTIMELFVIGLASLLLAVEPNNKRIEGTFLKTVIAKSLPNAAAMFVPVLIVMLLGNIGFVSDECRNSTAMIIVIAVGLINLYSICIPFSKWRASVCLIITAGLLATSAISIFLVNDIFMFLPVLENPVFTLSSVGIGICLATLTQILRDPIENAAHKFIEKRENAKTEKAKKE